MKKNIVEKGVEIGENEELETEKSAVRMQKYDMVFPSENGIMVVQKNGKYGAIKPGGTTVVSIKYDSFKRGFNDGIGVFCNNGILSDLESKYEVLIDKEGRIIKELFNMDCRPFFDNSFAVIYGNPNITGKNSMYYGLIDRNGNDIIKPQDKYVIYDVYKNMAIMEKINNSKKRYIVDRTGAKHKFFGYDDVKIIRENLICVGKNKNYLLTDIYNNKISSDYDNIRNFYTGGIDVILLFKNKRSYVMHDLETLKKLPDDFYLATNYEREEMIKKVISNCSSLKDKNDSSLNIYVPTDYKSLFESNIEKCLLSGYQVPWFYMKDDEVIIDLKYSCRLSNLKLKYIITIYKTNDVIIMKKFDSKDECDKYYDGIMKTIEECNISTENKTYKDDFIDKILVKAKK